MVSVALGAERSSANGLGRCCDREPGQSLRVEQAVELFAADKAGIQHQRPDAPSTGQRGLCDVRRGGIAEIGSERGDDADTPRGRGLQVLEVDLDASNAQVT